MVLGEDLSADELVSYPDWPKEWMFLLMTHGLLH